MPVLLPEWPSARDEAFRASRFKALAGVAFAPAHTALGTQPEALPAGVTLTPGAALPDGLPETPLVARAAAQADESWQLTVAANTEAALALNFFFGGENHNAGYAPKLTLRLERGARLTLIERHLSSAAAALAVNMLTAVTLAEGAVLEHLFLQEMDRPDHHFSTAAVRLGAASRYHRFNLVCGAALSRQELQVTLAGADARCVADGLLLLAGTQQGDLTTHILHQAAHGHSRQTVRAALAETAEGIFQGRIAVAPGATGNDAAQLSRALLLAPGAAMNSKPELEICNDEVACSHGATIGALDDEALFYLQSRGLTAEAARALLVEGFVGESLETLPPVLATEAEAALAGWLEAHHG